MEGAARRIHGAGEFGQHAVADRLHDAPAMGCDAGSGDCFSERLEPGQGGLFVGMYQAGVVLDRSRQHRRQPSLHPLTRHKTSNFFHVGATSKHFG